MYWGKWAIFARVVGTSVEKNIWWHLWRPMLRSNPPELKPTEGCCIELADRMPSNSKHHIEPGRSRNQAQTHTHIQWWLWHFMFEFSVKYLHLNLRSATPRPSVQLAETKLLVWLHGSNFTLGSFSSSVWSEPDSNEVFRLSKIQFGFMGTSQITWHGFNLPRDVTLSARKELQTVPFHGCWCSLWQIQMEIELRHLSCWTTICVCNAP